MIIIIKKNSVYTVNISAVTSNGDGIAKHEDYPLFVKGGVTGDELDIRVTKTNKTYGFGKIEKLVKPSSHRACPPCEISERCGGCDFMHISYDYQKQIKSESVIGNLQRIGGIHPEEYQYDGIIGADNTLWYRNKAQLPIGNSHGRCVTGFYSRGSHEIVPLSECLIQNKDINKATEIFLEYANRNSLSVYNEATHKGLLRHLYIRTGNTTDEMLFTIVTNGRRPLPDIDTLASELKKHVNIKGIIQNINTRKTNLILGDENRLLWGQDTIVSMIGELKFIISPESFFQVNGEQTLRLYSKALEYAELDGTETVFDLYCGVGSISLFLAKKAKKVIGVEIVKKAIENAIENAKLNGISNAEFYDGDCAEVVKRLISEGENADVALVDPPRKGCSADLLELLRNMSPKKIVYVSCNSATLARDVKILKEYGYSLSRVCAVDMFPNSGHCEVVAELRSTHQ